MDEIIMINNMHLHDLMINIDNDKELKDLLHLILKLYYQKNGIKYTATLIKVPKHGNRKPH